MIPRQNTFDKKLLSSEQLTEIIPYSIVHIYRLMKRGDFPKPLRLGANRVAWLEQDVKDWLDAKIIEKETRHD